MLCEGSMIYANHAGTSWPKPAPVHAAVAAALAADPGEWAESFARHHSAVARFFAVAADDLLLTPGCTSALSVGVLDHPWRPGDRLIVDALAHRALHRPALQLRERGVVVVEARAAEVEAHLLAGPVRLVALSAADNVTGARIDVPAVVALAHAHGARVLIDAAQVAGWLDREIGAWRADLVAFAGHKGPQGPWGIGGLILAPGLVMASPREDGTADRPWYCDVGSVDRLALAGLAAGCGWSAERPHRLRDALRVRERLEAALPADAVVLGGRERVPTVAYTRPGRSVAEEVARLRERGVIASGGLQCAPLAHRAWGTAPDGVVRLSLGPGMGAEELGRLVEAVG
ncbi:MAG: selenocysteine lyase/cysteine desulfurase [Myxococcota bacterium]|jgi:selenocysteine lyase/cysteine desulfurase